MKRRILISGASIAGCSTAFWLDELGDFDITIVERAPDFRDGGQNVDVRGAGREVIRRMSLERAALDLGTGETGTAWVNEDGSTIGEVEVGEAGGDTATAEMEILRGDLAQLLYDQIQDRCTFRFGDHITAVDDQPNAVTVTFASSKKEDFDLVVIAEGVGSSTREIVFPGENEPYWLDMTMAYFTIARQPDDDTRWRWYHTTHGRSVSLRPDAHGTTRAILAVQKPPEGEQDWDVERQKQWLREQFADAGWEAPRILAELDSTPDFYFDVLRQSRLPQWFRGRVALTGDAAWCVTPLGGVGATLALVGGYILAGELTRGTEHGAAFTAYQNRLRDFVDKAQNIKKAVPRMANPHSRLGLALLRGSVKLATSPAVKDALDHLVSGRADDIELPDYRRIPAATPAA